MVKRELMRKIMSSGFSISLRGVGPALLIEECKGTSTRAWDDLLCY